MRTGVPASPCRDSRDNMEPIGFDGIVGDAGHFAEIDAFALDRPQAVGVGGPQRSQGKRATKRLLRISMVISLGLDGGPMPVAPLPQKMIRQSLSIKQIGSIMGIDTVNLARIDLNLLVHFDALLTERSVTRAAARVGIGQSAMSHNLARLRELFGDELLTRGPEGLRLTPRAVTLVEPVRTTLAQIQTLVSRDQTFDPATAVRTFRFGLPDSMEILIVPTLLARLCEVAPGIHLRLYNISGKARVAALGRPDHATFPCGPVLGGACTRRRNHARATGSLVRRRARAQPQPASGGVARGSGFIAVACSLRSRSSSHLVTAAGGPTGCGPLTEIDGRCPDLW